MQLNAASVDLSKSVFQLSLTNHAGKIVDRKRLSRSTIFPLVGQIRFTELGFQVLLLGFNNQSLQCPYSERCKQQNPPVGKGDYDANANKDHLQVHWIASDLVGTFFFDMGGWFPRILALTSFAN